MTGKHFLLLTCVFFNGLFCFSQIDKGLVASYYFSGDANDCVSAINGTVRGAGLETDRFGNAYSAYCFDGKDDYITLGKNAGLKQPVMSISLWVKLNAYESKRLNCPSMPLISTKARIAVQRDEAYGIALLNNHRFSGVNTSSLEDQVATVSYVRAKVDKWYHIVYMFDTDTTYFFLNGEFQQKSFKGFVTNYVAADSVVIGYTGNGVPDSSEYRNYAWFNGCIDDVKFYDRLLNPSEIKQLYNEPSQKYTGKPDDPVKINLFDLIKKYWFIPAIIFALIVVIIYTLKWRIKFTRKKERLQNELQNKFAQMEMKALRSQMNPHFIFNAINSIQHYVLTNERELANKYLVKFSQLIRNILDLSKQELISLASELETINLYLDIESLRFNNAFNYSINVSPSIVLNDVRLPPLIIQPFVENAIWHGLLLKEGNKKLTINVSENKEYLVIEIDDNGIGRAAAQKFVEKELKRRSFGMDITQDRLNVLGIVFGLSISFKIIDKIDDAGTPLGTTVFINVKL